MNRQGATNVLDTQPFERREELVSVGVGAVVRIFLDGEAPTDEGQIVEAVQRRRVDLLLTGLGPIQCPAYAQEHNTSSVPKTE